MIKNYLRLAKVIVKNKMSRFYGSVCTLAIVIVVVVVVVVAVVCKS